MPNNGNLDLQAIIKDQNGKFLLRNLGSTYLCNRLSHRWLREGRRWIWVVMAGCIH